MAVGYRAIDWNRFKAGYDLWLGLGVVLFLAGFVAVSLVWVPAGESFHPVQLAMRGLGAAAFALLTLVLAIGPLARLTALALPLLYNRRHLGVTTFLVGAAHAALVMVWYYGFSKTPPLLGLWLSHVPVASISAVPFELFGLAALIILFAMAATSHDHWLRALGPARWKALHMGVYLAYGLLVAHIACGALQSERADIYALALLSAAGLVVALHLITGIREYIRDAAAERLPDEATGQWLNAGPAMDIPDGRAVIVSPMDGDRIAVFRDGLTIYAVSNVCPHQNGPLGEGRIIDGCITCPWHGWQYRPTDGRSPPPFEEKIATYRVKVEQGVAYVRSQPMPPGTLSPGAMISKAAI